MENSKKELFISEETDTFINALAPLHSSPISLLNQDLLVNQVAALGVAETAKYVSLSDTQVYMSGGPRDKF